MRIDLKQIWSKLLKRLRLSPLSLAEKCRIAFGAAVVFILTLALLLPYIWMGQLTKKALLDTNKAEAETHLMDWHFQTSNAGQTTPPALADGGKVWDVNDTRIKWIRFTTDSEKQIQQLNRRQRELLEQLRAEGDRDDDIIMNKNSGTLESNYVRIFRATEGCIGCHNSEGIAANAFSLNEPIGAAVIRRPVLENSKIVLMNRLCIIVAGMIAGAGAVVAFYVITQRVILSPIRQLRALANNVAEGNLDIRSSIKTRDEYEKFANSFNHMLDTLQKTQVKLREANIQLDAKIAELSERNIELYKANKIKGEFLANISHEFRTPLNAILGFAEILREKPGRLGRDKGKRYAENIITSGKSLLNMINDLLALAKTEAGKMELHIEKISMPELCRISMGHFSAITKSKKIKIKLVLADDIPVLVTDGGKVQQIVSNFISNAVKFTADRGRLEIRANMLDDKTVRIAVSDNGCGIAEADKEKIFEKFRQADGSITRQSSGSGLGLAICKELAAMLAGSIGMESELGKGSTFWIDIPVTLAKEQTEVA